MNKLQQIVTDKLNYLTIESYILDGKMYSALVRLNKITGKRTILWKDHGWDRARKVCAIKQVAYLRK